MNTRAPAPHVAAALSAGRGVAQPKGGPPAGPAAHVQAALSAAAAPGSALNRHPAAHVSAAVQRKAVAPPAVSRPAGAPVPPRLGGMAGHRVVQRMETSTSSGGSTGLLSGKSKRWQIGALVLASLQRIVNYARTSGNPQMTGDYPRFEDDIARAMTLDSEWTGKKTSAYEGVNVGAFALMDTAEGEVVGTAFNVGGKADWERTEKTMDVVFGSADLPTDYVPIKKKEGRKQDVHTHAEMKIADLSGAPFGTYIGISKECCLCCAAALLVQGKYRFGGCHGQAFDNWPMPSFIRNNPANLRAFMGEAAWALYSPLTAGKHMGLPEPDLYQGDFLDWLETAWGTLS